MDRTIDYYEKNAESFADGTVDVEFAEIQDKFISQLPKNGYIMDFGCGSGRICGRTGFGICGEDGISSWAT